MLASNFQELVFNDYKNTKNWLTTFKNFMPSHDDPYKFSFLHDHEYQHIFLVMMIQEKIEPIDFSSIIRDIYQHQKFSEPLFMHFFNSEEEILNTSFTDDDFDSSKLLFLSLNKHNKIILNPDTKSYLLCLFNECDAQHLDNLAAAGLPFFLELFKHDFSKAEDILSTLLSKDTKTMLIMLSHIIKDMPRAQQHKSYQSLIKSVPNIQSLIEPFLFYYDSTYETQKTLLITYFNIVAPTDLIYQLNKVWQQFFEQHKNNMNEGDLFIFASHLNGALNVNLEKNSHINCDFNKIDTSKLFEDNLIFFLWMSYQIKQPDFPPPIVEYSFNIIEINENKNSTYNMNFLLSEEFLSYIKKSHEIIQNHQSLEELIPKKMVANIPKPKV